MTTTPQMPKLEKSLEEISRLIEQMEHGDPTLEQSLEYFERGIHLIKHAQKLLQDAEHKVQILLDSNQGKLQSYENKDENA